MMRAPGSWAVAVRRPDGGIERFVQDIVSPMQKRRIWRLPVVRGVMALGESLAIGFRALAISANVASRTENEEGEVETEIGRGTIIFSFVIVEGAIRVSILVAYVSLIGLLPDLRRVFQYHAAEHKAINALEAGKELTPENVQECSLIHPRCGTAFLLWVMVIGVFVFALVGRPNWYWLVASRILLLPVIAGLAYELIRFAGKHPHSRTLRILLAPGLWLQRLTTRQPSLDQIEVSIRALREVLDREGGGLDPSRVEIMA